MRFSIKIKKCSVKELVFYLFLLLCFIPFLFPNPIVKTNIQPYAALLGTLILLFHFGSLLQYQQGRVVAVILSLTFFAALIVMIAGGVTMEAVRGVYNYYALFIIPCVVIIVLCEFQEFPEGLLKAMILIWFFVASVQFFVYRGFATRFIASVRWSYQYRGVVGLASEPSFLGITCFYFLHLVRKIKKNKLFFTALVLIMGVLYAQSTTGIVFIAGYIAVYLFDMIDSKRGLYIWIFAILVLAIFAVYLNTRLVNSRLYHMISDFFNGGIDSILSDQSASVRYNAIGRALTSSATHRFLPSGFGSRIGSAYGGLLVELGLFAVPAMILISFGLSLTFEKARSRVLYFIVVTLLLLNNTQIGNPLLLMVVGTNLFSRMNKKKHQEVTPIHAAVYQGT